MPHDDRTREGPLDNAQEWSRCNWFTHPAFKSLMHSPDPAHVANMVRLGTWEGDCDSLWALRAAMANLDHDGMRACVVDLFREECIPRSVMALWPHDNQRSRFLKEEIARKVSNPAEELLMQLAQKWPWLWVADAQKQGMGEAHPIARLVRAEREDVVFALYRHIQPSQWLDWQDQGSDRMVALLMRQASHGAMSSLIVHDPSMLAWCRKKEGRNLLHEACSKLRPDLVALLLQHGMAATSCTGKTGETPAQVALGSVIEKIRPRQKSVSRKNDMMERLDDILHLLGSSGGLKAEARVLMEELGTEDLARMRAIVERALLSSVSEAMADPGEPRRL